MRGCRWCGRCGVRETGLPEAPYRVAVYYAPALEDPLWAASCAWLGRDPERSVVCGQPPVEGIYAATSSPRRYGPHATLKPPMQLRGCYDDFVADVARLAASLEVLLLPPLAAVYWHHFLALCPVEPSAQLNFLAARCVTELDHHRLPEDAAAQSKRAIGRSPRQLENLALWGYPLVLDDWQFHITLSNAGAAALLAPATEFFAPALAQPRLFNSLAIFCEDEPGAKFRLAARLPFGA